MRVPVLPVVSSAREGPLRIGVRKAHCRTATGIPCPHMSADCGAYNLPTFNTTHRRTRTREVCFCTRFGFSRLRLAKGGREGGRRSAVSASNAIRAKIRMRIPNTFLVAFHSSFTTSQSVASAPGGRDVQTYPVRLPSTTRRTPSTALSRDNTGMAPRPDERRAAALEPMHPISPGGLLRLS